MLIVYGTPLCPDCVKCLEDLDAANVSYEYLNICEDLRNMKAFLKLRDESTLFDEVRSQGKIGIPCIQREDGTLSLEWDEFLK